MGTVRRQCVKAGLVKVNGVFFKAIVGREVHAAAKPSYGLSI